MNRWWRRCAAVFVAALWLTSCTGSGTNPSTNISLSLASSTVVGGGAVQGTISLTGGSTSGTVTLSSNNTQVVTVPLSVAVNGSATFTVPTVQVISPTTVTITASFGGSQSVTATLNVTPPVTPVAPTLAAFTLSASNVTSGNSVTGTVTLSSAAPAGGTTVTLSSNDTNLVIFPLLQPSVTVAAGSTSATFTISTGSRSVTFQIVISASLGTVTLTANLEVDPAVPDCTFNVTSTGDGGSSQQAGMAGGTFGIRIVPSPSSCSWSAASRSGTPAGMITFNGVSSGTGTSSLSYNVSQNTTGATRNGGITVQATGGRSGSKNFSVTQSP